AGRPAGLPARRLRRGIAARNRDARAQVEAHRALRADDEDRSLVPRTRLPLGDHRRSAAAEAVALQLSAPVARLPHTVVSVTLVARLVQCVKLGHEAEGLDFPPYPGELGKRIYENVSKEAWQGWVQHQTMTVE